MLQAARMTCAKAPSTEQLGRLLDLKRSPSGLTEGGPKDVEGWGLGMAIGEAFCELRQEHAWLPCLEASRGSHGEDTRTDRAK